MDPSDKTRSAWGTFAALVLALCPIETINLWPRPGQFALSPFLCVSPVFAICALARISVRPRRPVRNRAAGLAALCLCATALASVIWGGPDPLHLAWRRLALLVWLVAFAYLFVRSCGAALPRVLLRGIKAYLTADGLFVAFQLMAAGIGPVRSAALAISNFATATWPTFWGGTLPRFGGLVADPNRAGAEVAMMLALAALTDRATRPGNKPGAFGWPFWVLGATIVTLTISRTGLVALAIAAAIAVSAMGGRRRAATLAGAILGSATAILALALDRQLATRATYNLLASPARQASTATHFALIRHGLQIALANGKNLLLGVGWGTGYVYTRRFFAWDKYGNFHSGYISLLVESGSLALLAYLALLALPFLKRNPCASAAAVLAWSNIFYQYQASPFHWILLAVLNWGALAPSLGLPTVAYQPRTAPFAPSEGVPARW